VGSAEGSHIPGNVFVVFRGTWLRLLLLLS
jgi:hypothetical protein